MAVRANIFSVYERVRKDVVAAAQQELEVADREQDENEGNDERFRQLMECKKMINSWKARNPKVDGSLPEVKDADFYDQTPQDTDGDVEMAGMQAKTQAVINAQLIKELQKLLRMAEERIRKYDQYADGNLKLYRGYLEKHKPSGEVLPIKRKAEVAATGNAEANSRRSSLVPSTLRTPISPLKEFEMMEALSRRGSNQG
jgi:hypothetical protein